MISGMDEAIHFYTEMLGLELKNRYGDHYAEIDAKGLVIGLHPASDQVKVGDNMSIGFVTDEFDDTLETLKSRDVQCTVTADGWSRIAHFTDTNGNALYLIENRKG